MKAKGKNHRKERRSGKCPKWLVLGALAATTTVGRLEATHQPVLLDRPVRDRGAQTVPPRRELPLGFHETPYLTLFAAPSPMADDRPAQSQPAVRFDIPAGPLETVLKAYHDASGVSVKVSREALVLPSPGVSGLLTADQALEALLDGTGVTYRFLDARTAELEAPFFADTIQVTVPSPMSSPKYTQPLRDTPQTLTVIPSRLIEEQNATTLRDVLRNVPGISIQAGEGGGGLPGDNLSIRGFASRNDIFVDGVRDFGAYTRDPFNIEQVEVTKGPSSLYIGRGSTGGSLNLSSKRPLLEEVQNITLGAGTDGYGRTTVDVNQPLDSFGVAGAAFRVNAMFTQGDTPGRDAVENRRWGLAPSFAFGLGTPTRVTLSYSHLDQDNVPDYGLPWVPATNTALPGYADQPAPVDYDNFYGLTDRDYEKTVTGIATGIVEHDVNDAVTMRTLARYGKSERDSIITAPRFAGTDSTTINRQLQSRDLTDNILALQHDVTTRFNTGALGHSLVAGVEVAREEAENHSRSGPTAPVTDLFNPNPNDPYLGPITRTGARTESTADTLAVYASDTVKLNEKWQVTGGLRWDNLDVDYKSVAVDGVETPFDRSDSMLSWQAGVVHKPRENGSIYLAAGTSFNPSSEGNTGLSLTDATVNLEPEESLAYELGTKWDLFDERLALNVAAFQTEKTNARTPGINPGDPPTVLDGRQRIRGVEVGVTGNLTSRWSTALGYTYMESEILESNTPAEVGKELSNTPKSSASLWTTYRLGFGLEIGGGAQYVGDRFNNFSNSRTAPSYWLFDAMVSYDINDQFTLRLNGTNLANERYIDRVGGGHFIPGQSRSVALTTAVKF